MRVLVILLLLCGIAFAKPVKDMNRQEKRQYAKDKKTERINKEINKHEEALARLRAILESLDK